MVDYSKYPKSNRFYTGAEKKIGILIKNKPYFVKFRKNSPAGYRFNHVSEFIGSQIFSSLGLVSQETKLGFFDGEEVVIIRDFLEEGEVFVPFNAVGDSSMDEDKEKYQYEYKDIIEMLQKNIKLTNVNETIDCFWNMYIVDALIGNFDRHGSNWGFIKKHNAYRIAPVFDNGSCLFPLLNTDEKITITLKSKNEINKRIYEFPTSQIKLNNAKSSYFEIINSLMFPECNKALEKIVNRFDLEKIEKIIETTDFISEQRKYFYKTIINERFEKILRIPYIKMTKEGINNVK